MRAHQRAQHVADEHLAYEQRLTKRRGWALEEGERYFKKDSEVHKALREICRRLDELGISYAVAGGLALSAHGFHRFTDDIHILVNRAGLRSLHEHLDGRGYIPPFEGSKNLRDTQHRVRIEFLVAGDFPGDGKPKPVSFPDPASVAVDVDGINYLGLASLIQLKLASGMTNAARMKDLADVLELIRLLRLDVDFGSKLDPFVRPKYQELHDSLRSSPKRFVRIWRNKFLALDAKSIEEMAATLRAAADELAQMIGDGVVLDPNGGTGDDYAYLITSNPEIARKYGFEDEDDMWGSEEDSEAEPGEPGSDAES